MKSFLNKDSPDIFVFCLPQKFPDITMLSQIYPLINSCFKYYVCKILLLRSVEKTANPGRKFVPGWDLSHFLKHCIFQGILKDLKWVYTMAHTFEYSKSSKKDML